MLRCGGAQVSLAVAPHVRHAVAAQALQSDTYFKAIELLSDRSHVRDYSCGEWEAPIARARLLPTASAAYRVRLIFQIWVQRMRTPPAQVDAIRALMAAMFRRRRAAIGA